MPKRSETPIEEREYSVYYLILAGLLALTTFWAILDMISFRAPWQRHQKKFNEIEYQNVAQKLAEVREELNLQYADHLAQLTEQLQQAKAHLQGQAYEDLQADLHQADVEIDKAMQAYRFAKSEYDALWYEYKHAEHAGQDSKAQKLRKKVDALISEVASLKIKWDEAEVQKEELEARLLRYRSAVDSLQKEYEALVEPVKDHQEKLTLIDHRKISIKQVVLPNFVRGNFESFLDKVDRCTSCHVNADKRGYEDYPAPFQSHPDREWFFKTHPVNKFACSSCHEGQGPALQEFHAHGYDKHWEHPLLKNELVEAGCNKCHNKELSLDHAPNLSRAKRMVFDLGCFGCHEIAGYEKARKIGPPLSKILSKTTPNFIYQWVKDTKSFRQHSRMPNPQYSHDEAAAVTAYLYSVSKNHEYKPAKVPAGGSASRGEKLVESVGCKGCHVITEQDRQVNRTDVSYDIAPELTKIGSKVNRDWLYAWIKNPKQYNPNTTMPNLRLNDTEARDIVAYLMSNTDSSLAENQLQTVDLNSKELVAEGQAIIRNFGCHGCHDIPGMEKEGKVSVALNEFGAKTPEELFFGDALADGRVPEETWYAWTKGKMLNSRMYETEAVAQRMPNFAFSEEEANTMTLILKSWDGRVIGKEYLHDMGRLGDAIEKGRRLVRQYNCIGCHIIEGQGGFIRSILAESFKVEGRAPEEAISFAPPDLIGEGRKVQPDWLFGFLKNPTINIRPWLNIRMPSFDLSDEEVNQLIEYFQALEGMSEAFMEIDVDLTSEEIKAAETLFSTDYLSCYSCHQVGKKKPEGPPAGWAPDFLLAPDRLNPDWVFDWIANPQAQQPGTKMPGFYPDAAPPNIFEGNPEKQIEALTDYLMNIHRFVKN
ncbi:MAG: c-type cytochrome [bacterium]